MTRKIAVLSMAVVALGSMVSCGKLFEKKKFTEGYYLTAEAPNSKYFPIIIIKYPEEKSGVCLASYTVSINPREGREATVDLGPGVSTTDCGAAELATKATSSGNGQYFGGEFRQNGSNLDLVVGYGSSMKVTNVVQRDSLRPTTKENALAVMRSLITRVQGAGFSSQQQQHCRAAFEMSCESAYGIR